MSPSCLRLKMFITHCRHRILYPLRLEPSFPNDAEILKPKVDLGPNQITN